MIDIIDINECDTYGVCDQYCINSPGKYECSCDSDYELVNNHRCKIKGIDFEKYFNRKYFENIQ